MTNFSVVKQQPGALINTERGFTCCNHSFMFTVVMNRFFLNVLTVGVMGAKCTVLVMSKMYSHVFL